MAKIFFKTPSGDTVEVDASNGESVMEAAVSADVEGIDADCGGACACATCQVHVDPEWIDKTGTADSMEADMLEMEEDVTKYSRLTCQITVTDDLDGLKVTVTGR